MHRHKISVPTFDFSSAWSNDCSTLERSSVSVVIPTLNPGDELPTLLSSLKSQEGCENVEIIVVDSGSRDDTVELSRAYGAKVIEIAPKDFSHSAARNLGADAATGDYLLFMTQDALPGSRRFLYEMIQAARTSGAVAVSPAESPREDVDLFYCVNSHNHIRFLKLDGGDRVTGAPPSSDYETVRRHCQLNNVACLIERGVFTQYRFRSDYAEDLDLGLRLTADGHKLVLLSSTRVIHSHNRPAYYHLRRGFVETVSMAKTFTDFPILPTTDLPALSQGMLSSYQNLSRALNSLESELQFPCSTIQFLAAIEKRWNGPTPATNTIETFDVDDRYREFLTRLAADFSAPEKDVADDKAITATVNDMVWRIKNHLNSVYEIVDQALFTEFKQAVFKSHAMAAGVILASYFLSSPANDDATARLELELRQGV
ncbi:MAG: glycosyltransferase [Acidobacteria bacterium]|nr:glycosyltransferase [Acidobacteriota bacterium]